jgi:hypothetical protein
MSRATMRTHLGSLKDAVEKLDISQGTLDVMILMILSRERWYRASFAVTSVLEGA